MKAASLTVTLALLLVGAPLWADIPASTSGQKKAEERPEFDIKCKDRAYTELIRRLMTVLADIRNRIEVNNAFIEKAKAEGRDPGPADLPGRPSIVFVVPQELSVNVFLSKARRALDEQNEYYQKLEHKTLLRKDASLRGNESLVKDMIGKADARCLEIEEIRARSASLGEPIPHATAIASTTDTHSYR